MAARVADKVSVDLDTTWDKYVRGLQVGQRAFDRTMKGMTDSGARAERQIRDQQNRISDAIRNVAAGVATAATVQAVTAMADSYTKFTNQLRLAGLEGGRLAGVQDQLYQSAQRNGVELETLGTLYGRLAQAGKELGATDQDLIRFTSGVAAAIRIQGGSAADAQGALLQLSQALGGTIVRAEEYNSINEGARPILQAVANGNDRFAGSVSKLRNEVIAGTVTSREFYQAFLAGSAQLETQAARANLTIGQSLTILRNALVKYIGESDTALGASRALGSALGLLANNLESVIPAIAALAVVLGARLTAGMLGAGSASIRSQIAFERAGGAALTAALKIDSMTASTARFATAGEIAAARAGIAAAQMTRMQIAAQVAGTMMQRAGAGILAVFGGPVGLAITAVSLALGSFAIEAANASAAAAQFDQVMTSSQAALDKAQAYAGNAAAKVNSLGGEAAVAEVKVDRFAGAVGRAAQQLYNLAAAKKAAAIAELETERITVSKATTGEIGRTRDARRRDAWDELNFQGRHAQTLGESWSRLSNLVVGEVQSLWTGGQSDRDRDARVSQGRGRLNEIDGQLAALRRLSVEDFADEARQDMAGAGGAKPKGGGKGSGRSGPTREELQLQARLDAARAAGNEAEVRALETVVDLQKRIDAYKQAGLSASDAEVQAAKDQALILTARERAFEKERQRMADTVSAEVARTAENADQVRAIERKVELEDRIEAYARAGLGIVQATTRATEEQARLDIERANAAARRRSQMAEEVALQVLQIQGAEGLGQALEDQRFVRDQIRAYQEQELSLADATLQANRDLAAIQEARAQAQDRYLDSLRQESEITQAENRGDTREARRLRTRLDAGNRVRDRVRNGQDPNEAAQEVSAQMGAEARAELQGAFRDTFRDGVKAALEGDLGEFFQGWVADRAAAALEEGLNKIADFAFDALVSAIPNLGGLADTASDAAAGAAEAAAQQAAAAAVAASITAAGVASAAAVTTAGTAMAAAIIAAGAEAAAAITLASAASNGSGGGGPASLVNSFLGAGKARGGRTYPGMAYPVNEGKGDSEWFIPDGPGVIVPQGQGSGGGGGATVVPVTLANNTGVPMRLADNGKTGDERRLSLEPIMEEALTSAAKSGALSRAERQRRRPVTRG